MIQSSRRKVIVIATLAVFIGSLSIFNTQPSHAASLQKTSELSTNPQSTLQAWVQRVTPYVHISSHYIATLAVNANQHLSSKDIADARIAISQYNALSESEKSPSQITQKVDVNASQTGIHPYANLCNLGDVRMVDHRQWWGNQWYVNDCFIYWASPANIIAAGGIGVLILWACGATVVCGAVAVVMGTILAVEYWALDHDTNACGHRGAYINIPWAGGAWPSPVC